MAWTWIESSELPGLVGDEPEQEVLMDPARELEQRVVAGEVK